MTCDAIPHPFKVFGLQRTGTNLIRALLTRNFHMGYLEESATGWKHGPSRIKDTTWNGTPIRFIVCVKNPYAWASSCYRFFRRVHDGDVTMAPQFQRDPSMSFDEFVMTPSYTFETPIHRWNEMNRLWLSTLPAERTLVVRQEDLVEDQIPILQQAEQHLQLKRQSDKLQSIDQRVDVDATLRGAMNRQYYLDREYLADYSPSLLDRVNHWVDPSLMTQLGYELERWTLAERNINGLRLVVRPGASDAAEARQMTFNPYHLDQVRHSELDIRTAMDLGAGIGGWTAFAKTLWPGCRIWACEPCAPKLRVLRINARRLADVTVVGAVIADDSVAKAASSESASTSTEPVPTLSLEELFKRCGRVNLLRIGCLQDAPRLLHRLVSGGFVKEMACVCGTLAPDGTAEHLLQGLAQTHSVETWAMPSGVYFRGERSA